ncbi:MAG TPA: succinylglutamate desuccinylase/aspartoacylase family protein [Patescibacteria group bacterium]|jgi:succinylglutamate desuccinylase|nr:succinylglutamate desuccinylase/aspartoacylase family protein [Patescibacteria group bacterium]
MTSFSNPATTLAEFLQGNPAEIVGADQMPRILIIGLHGNEELAARTAHRISTRYPELLKHVDYICGNPIAAAAYTRASTPMSDLNRSFKPKVQPLTYEERRAQQLLPIIKNYDYVLDIHTSQSDCDRLFLTANPDNAAVRKIISCSTIKRIVVMPQHIASNSLIGHVGQSISIEYNETLAHSAGAPEEIVSIVKDLIIGSSANRQREFYYVDCAVPKNEDPGDVQNFVRCSTGYYPILFGTGPKTYRNNPSRKYIGFAAAKMERIVL